MDIVKLLCLYDHIAWLSSFASETSIAILLTEKNEENHTLLVALVSTSAVSLFTVIVCFCVVLRAKRRRMDSLDGFFSRPQFPELGSVLPSTDPSHSAESLDDAENPVNNNTDSIFCLLYTSPSPRDA